MTKTVYRGKYFSVKSVSGYSAKTPVKYYVYSNEHKQAVSGHRLMSVAKNKAMSLNTRADKLAWWDR